MAIHHRGPMTRCKNCLLPDKVPGADLDADGVCGPCRAYRSDPQADAARESRRRAHEEDLERTLRGARGGGEYDCLACLSGGKDSVYLLHRLVRDYRLRVLAYTLDFDLPDVAWDSIRRTVRALELDHLVYTPSSAYYKKLTRFLLTHQGPGGAVETVCYVWAPLRDGYVLRLATERKIPLVLVGYSPGQEDPYKMEYELSQEVVGGSAWRPGALAESGEFDEWELGQFWDPRRYPGETRFPRFLAPFRAWKYDQADIIRRVVELGLVASRKNANPIFSNFSMNWLFMYSDLKNLGYNPYVPEFSKLIREGKASLRQWRILAPLVDWMIRRQVLLGRNVRKSLDWLGLKPEDLVIRG